MCVDRRGTVVFVVIVIVIVRGSVFSQDTSDLI